MNVKELIKKMTIAEKISLLDGSDAWHTKDIKRLNIPSIMMTDGPHGIRKELPTADGVGLSGSEVAVSFPTASTISLSFDKNLAYLMGKAIGEEARSKDVQLVLGPGVNIKRHPLCGRNFEYYSEDPLLSGTLGSAFIEGVESNNVGACVKHFACNSQEEYRFTIDSIVDERALREIYLKAFKMCVDAKASALMSSYNRINGSFGSENKYLLTDILRNEWNYKGLTITDWGACNNRTDGLLASQDLEMPSSKGYRSAKLLKAFEEGLITTEELDASVERILEFVSKTSLNPRKECSFDEHHKLTQTIAANSSVLLKNENRILPLYENDNVALIGSLAETSRFQGGGSSFMNPYKIDNILDNIKDYSVNYTYAPGYSLKLDGYDEQLVNQATELASTASKVVLIIGLPAHYETEGCDRKDLKLPLGQLKLIEELHKVNKNIIAVVVSGSVVELPFVDQVKAILWAGLGGEGAGRAILDNLYGVVNPSGRLSETIGYSLDDYITNRNYNTTNNSVWYQESIYVGYRYFNTFDKKVMFPFGYGLSYTTFEYKNLKVNNKHILKNKKIKVSVDVTNSGSLKGSEVVMVFVQNNPNSSVYKAKRELRSFEKITLNPKETQTVTFELDYDDFSYYDVYMKKPHVDEGYYKVQICKNVEEVLLEVEVERKDNDQDFVKHPQTTYNRRDRLVLKDEDFKAIYGKELPPKSVVRKRPFDFTSTLDDISSCFVGKIINKKIRGAIASQDIKEDQQWLIENTIRGLGCITMKNLIAFGGDIIDYYTMEALIDLLNNKYFTAIKKLLKGRKK